MGGSKGFSVEPHQLREVANRVHQLLESVSGNHGVSGNRPDFEQAARSDSLTNALKSFWVGDDVFANAYDKEHSGIVETFKQMEDQLKILEKSCRDTAAGYHEGDRKSADGVTTSGTTER